MPSFDIVSKVDMSEVDNALAGMKREIGQRHALREERRQPLYTRQRFGQRRRAEIAIAPVSLRPS